jgi:Icc-related predicted phosphoesterase
MMQRSGRSPMGSLESEHREGGRPSGRGTSSVGRVAPLLAAMVTLLGTVLVTTSVPAGASSPADQGVTSKTISLGVPYVNFQALRALGVTTNEGSFPDAYTAIADYMNAHGGFDGRKAVLHFDEMDPAIASDATSSCSTLTEDDHIFISLSPVFPDCYQQNHDTLVIAGSLPGALPASAAADFSLSPPDAAFDPLLLSALDKRGTFKGKKVAIFYGADSDKPEVTSVQADLKKLHVNVLLTAEDSVQATDAVASDQEVQTIAQRFQSSGVNVVIGVGGSGSTTWPRALLDNQSTYKPQYIATSESSLVSYVNSTKGGNSYLDGVLAGLPTPFYNVMWKDPAIQTCVKAVRKAYPSDSIATPPNPTSPSASSVPSTYVSVVQACQDLALVAKIADAAGKKLTTASFTKAGESLRNVTFPGSGGPVSFGPNRPYAIGPVIVVTYSPTSKTMVPATSSTK